MSFAGRLSVHIAWNGAFHADDLVDGTMKELEGVIGREMGVELVREGVDDLVF